MRALTVVVFTIGLVSYPSEVSAAWGFSSGSDPGKVLLRDVQVLTLRDGDMTTGRRGAPVKQLNCVGGSAQGAFKPQVVQCYNRGFDGVDVQWECKTDMDNDFRFGRVDVICEGYDYPDDPYITRGSCGLEYTLDYTKEGERNKRSGHDYYGGGSSSSSWFGSHNAYDYKRAASGGGLSDLVVLFVVCVVVYAFYRTCIVGGDNNIGDRQYSSTDGDYPGGGMGGGGWRPMRDNYGNNYGGGGYDDGSCGGTNRGYGRGTGAANTGGGFWTGMGVGGLMGYMFGNRGTGYGGYNRGYGGYNRGYGGSTWGRTGGWGGGGWGGGGSSFGGSSGGGGTSSGTRTASGFGGTRRR